MGGHKLKKIKMLLTSREIHLIIAIRELRFGEITIAVRDGIPQQKIKVMKKNINIDELGIDKIT